MILFDEQGNNVSDQLLEKRIALVLEKNSWIIEGNSFPVLLDERVTQSDLIIFFDYHPLRVLTKAIYRDIKILLGKRRSGYVSKNNLFNFSYYLPYIFKIFPKRKQLLKDLLAQKNNKSLIIITSDRKRKELYELLKKS